MDDYFLDITNSIYEEQNKGIIFDWSQSPFLWIKILSSKMKGVVGERIIEEICSEYFSVQRSRNSDFDRYINEIPVEIKMSMLWETNEFCFQQIRNQPYKYCICLAFEPNNYYIWTIPKSIIIKKSVPQHGGKASEETRWLKFQANNIPLWLHDYGGVGLDGVNWMLQTLNE